MVRRSWRLKRAGLEVTIIKGAVEPYAKLPGHLEASQCLRVVTVTPMCGRITVHPNLAKQVQHARGVVCLNAKTPKEIGLLLPRVSQKSRPSDDHLGH